MTVYFDKENLLSLIRSDPDFFRSDVFRLIKNNLNVSWCWESIDDDFYKLFFKQLLTTGRGKLIHYRSRFNRPLESDFYKSDSEATKRGVFLLSDQEIEKLKDQGNILIEGFNESNSGEKELLNKLFLEDYQFSESSIIGDQLRSYSDLKKYCLPSQDIIIHDKYLFAGEFDLSLGNLKHLLSTLLHRNKSEINLVIYTIIDEKEASHISPEIIMGISKNPF